MAFLERLARLESNAAASTSQHTGEDFCLANLVRLKHASLLMRSRLQ